MNKVEELLTLPRSNLSAVIVRSVIGQVIDLRAELVVKLAHVPSRAVEPLVRCDCIVRRHYVVVLATILTKENSSRFLA